MSDLAILMELTQSGLWSVYVVFLRVGAALAFMPGLGEQTVPVQLKVIIGVVMSIALLPAVGDVGPPTVSRMILLTLTEPGIGLLIGVSLRLLLLAMQTAGSIAAQSTSLAQISAGAFADPMPAVGQMLTMAAVTLFFVLDLHVQAFLFVLSSYELFPIGIFPDPSDTAEWGISRVAHSFSLAFRLAAPFFLLSLVYNITLGAINRAMPQLMVIFVGAPVITWGSLAVFFVVCAAIMDVWADEAIDFIQFPFGGRP